MNTFFTADTHFQHSRILDYCKRPFQNVTEMDESLIKNWNAKVKIGDLVYHLGDIIFGDYTNILKRLNGKIFLILGSHDGNAFDHKDKFVDIRRLHEFKQNDISITLCHYAMRTWARAHYNTWHIFGHSHGHLEPFGKSFDVGVDAHEFQVWSLDEVIERMKKLPDNFNLVKKN